MKSNTLLLALITIIFSPAFTGASVANNENPLFAQETPIQAVLSAPITQAYRQRKKQIRIYFEGHFSYVSGDAQTRKLPVKIRTRGNFRRLNCARPPLQLNFRKKHNDHTLFEKQNKLKLVGPCKNVSAYQQLLAQEYLAYQIWEEVSDYHFKTRLLNLSYIDTDGKKKPWSSTTFVIEDVKDVAKRHQKQLLEVDKISRQQLDLQQTALLELFQLFIGNTDYSTLMGPPGSICCHNARLLANKSTTTSLIPVPYDFDVSGFVDAPYAVPAAQYPIKNVRQRYYSGWCKEEPHIQYAIQRFNDRKPQIYQTVQNLDLLSSKSRTKSTKYIDDFYELINDEARVEREIIGRCRGSLFKG